MSNPYIVYGTVYDHNGLGANVAQITFSIGIVTQIVFTNYKGEYVYDLANINYSGGDTVNYVVEDVYKNDKYSGTFVVSGENTNLNINMIGRTDLIIPPSNRSTQIYTIGGKPVSIDNPIPVIRGNELNGHTEVIGNVQTDWTITNDDGQPDSETITYPDGTQYTRSYTYSTIGGNRLLTRLSRWIKV